MGPTLATEQTQGCARRTRAPLRLAYMSPSRRAFPEAATDGRVWERATTQRESRRRRRSASVSSVTRAQRSTKNWTSDDRWRHEACRSKMSLDNYHRADRTDRFCGYTETAGLNSNNQLLQRMAFRGPPSNVGLKLPSPLPCRLRCEHSAKLRQSSFVTERHIGTCRHTLIESTWSQLWS